MNRYTLRKIAAIFWVLISVNFLNAQLAFENQQIDFGVIPSSTPRIKQVLSLKNNSDHVIVVRQIKASCGCTKAELAGSTSIKAGEKRDIDVFIDTRGKSGQQAVIVTAEDVDGNACYAQIGYKIKAVYIINDRDEVIRIRSAQSNFEHTFYFVLFKEMGNGVLETCQSDDPGTRIKIEDTGNGISPMPGFGDAESRIYKITLSRSDLLLIPDAITISFKVGYSVDGGGLPVKVIKSYGIQRESMIKVNPDPIIFKRNGDAGNATFYVYAFGELIDGSVKILTDAKVDMKQEIVTNGVWRISLNVPDSKKIPRFLLIELKGEKKNIATIVGN